MQPIAIPRRQSPTALHAHFSRPSPGTGPWPGVVVLHDMLGPTRDLRDNTARLAAEGYVTVAPDLYSDGAARCIKSLFRAMLTGQGATFDDIETVRRWLVSRHDCTGKVGVIGFCMGGGFALLCATRGFQAAAPNYPYAPGNLDTLLDGACPIVASFGSRDPLPHVTSRAHRLRALLRERAVPHDIEEYPEAQHAFMNRHDLGRFEVLSRVVGFSYHQPSAEHAWTRILRFFGQHLSDTPALP
jgi:carboxymethylenebutenolidase